MGKYIHKQNMSLMKTTQILLIAVFIGSSIAASCKKEHWCSQCHDDIPDICTACEAGGRYLRFGTCQTRLGSLIVGCQYYSTTKVVNKRDSYDCIKCIQTPWLKIDPSTDKGETVECKWRSPDEQNCVNTIPDCWQTICIRKLVSNKFEAMCNICTNGKVPSQDKKSCVGNTVKEVSSPANSGEEKKPSPAKSDEEKKPSSASKPKEDAPPQGAKKIKEDVSPQDAKKFDEDVPPQGAKKFNEDVPPQGVNRPNEEKQP